VTNDTWREPRHIRILRSVLALVRHLRRYPKWYAVASAWAIAMALLPVVHSATAVAPRRPSPAAVQAPAAIDSTARDIGHPPSSSATAQGLNGPPASPSTESAAPAPPSAPAQPDAPAASGGLRIPPPPSVPIPTVPAELDPVLAAVAPVAADACGALGLARVALSLVPAAVGGPLPFNDALAYLVPLYGACALIPLPGITTTCPVDALVASKEPKKLVGAYVPPPLVGLVLDQVAAMLSLGGLDPAIMPVSAALNCTTK